MTRITNNNYTTANYFNITYDDVARNIGYDPLGYHSRNSSFPNGPNINYVPEQSYSISRIGKEIFAHSNENITILAKTAYKTGVLNISDSTNQEKVIKEFFKKFNTSEQKIKVFIFGGYRKPTATTNPGILSPGHTSRKNQSGYNTLMTTISELNAQNSQKIDIMDDKTYSLTKKLILLTKTKNHQYKEYRGFSSAKVGFDTTGSPFVEISAQFKGYKKNNSEEVIYAANRTQ